MRYFKVTLVALLFASSMADATTRKVPQDFAKIQLAINAAVNGDTVLVAEGTYVENLIINKGIVLVSHFILDGDKNHISRTIIDGSQPMNADTASVIIIGPQSDSITIVQGFTIQRGKGTKVWCTADNTYWLSGGGIYMEPRSVCILNNRIINNTLNGTTALKNVFGGGISIGDYSGLSPHSWTIADNLIANNSIIGNATEDAGISVTGNGVISNNIVIGNSCDRNPALGSGSVYGGGITVRYNANVTIENNYIAKNNALHNGSALYFHAYNNLIPFAVVKNNIIAGNKVLDNTIGGTLMIRSGQYEIVNNTIVDNSGGTVFRIFDNLGPLSIKTMNNICYNAQIAGSNEFSFAQTTAVQKFYNTYNFTLSNTGVSTNIYGNPMFVVGDTLYRLQSSSLAVAHGAVSASVGGTTLYVPAVDYKGNARPSPSWSKPDMGAMESPYALPGFSAVHRVPQDFATIKSAIDSAHNGDLVLVSEGTYKENLVINKKITLASLYYPDKDTSHISKTILDGSAPTHADSGSVVVLTTGTDSTTLVTGFTITKGSGMKLPWLNIITRCGGGVVITELGGGIIRKNNVSGNSITVPAGTYGGAPGIVVAWPVSVMTRPQKAIINDNIIENNIVAALDNTSITEGGGIGVWQGYCRITGNLIKNNIVQWASQTSKCPGGGILICSELGGNDSMIVIGNTIVGNRSRFGGGIAVIGDGVNAMVVDNTIVGNTGDVVGGGIIVINTSKTVRISNNYIAKNNSPTGAGLSVRAMLQNTFVEVSNNLIQANNATGAGGTAGSGGAFSFYNNTGFFVTATCSNNIIAQNVTTSGSAIRLYAGVYNFINNTITDNQGTRSFFLQSNDGSITNLLLNNIIWNPGLSLREFNTDVYTTGSYNLVRDGFAGTSNISSDPLFVPNDTLFRLSNSSPALCGGIYKATLNGTLLTASQTDYLGNARPRPFGTRNDMGAIEHDSGSVLDPTLGVRDPSTNTIPSEYALSQNYPNPFNPSTTIRYSLPSSAHVTLAVYDLLGREIAALVNEEQSAGWKEVEWNAKNLSSGIYIYSLTAGTFRETKKMILIR